MLPERSGGSESSLPVPFLRILVKAEEAISALNPTNQDFENAQISSSSCRLRRTVQFLER